MSDKLRMNGFARRHLSAGEYEAIEANIPDGFCMTVQAEMGAGDWSIRIYDTENEAMRYVPVIVSKHHATIYGGATVALVKLAAAV